MALPALLRVAAQSAAFRHARLCITPGGVPHVKIVHDGNVVDKLTIDIVDPTNTYNAAKKIIHQTVSVINK